MSIGASTPATKCGGGKLSLGAGPFLASQETPFRALPAPRMHEIGLTTQGASLIAFRGPGSALLLELLEADRLTGGARCRYR